MEIDLCVGVDTPVLARVHREKAVSPLSGLISPPVSATAPIRTDGFRTCMGNLLFFLEQRLVGQ